MRNTIKNISDRPKEACGVIGILAPGKTKTIANMAYIGLSSLQHRGQESTGIVCFDFNKVNFHKNLGLVHQVFNKDILKNINGHIAIGHNRYSTMGENLICNTQPYILSSKIGNLALAHNGNIINILEIKQKLIKNGYQMTSTSDSEAIALLITAYIDSGKELEDAIKNTLLECKGSFSLVIATKDKLIAAKDKFGIRPLCLGVTYDGDIIVASETCALDTLNACYIKELEPSEVVVIDLNKNINSFKYTEDSQNKLCIFELIYFARPDSILCNSSTYSYRFNLGMELSKINPVEADLVISIPDSGNCAALGYSVGAQIPFAKGFIKNFNIGRTFILPDQNKRELNVKLKLNPIKDIIKNKRLIVVDDSIVRGTTSKIIVEMLFNAGAKEVHLRVSSPPVKHPCFFGIDTDDYDQLIASKENIKNICSYINADSLEFLPVNSLYNTNKLDPEKFCSACFTGNYFLKPEREFSKAILNKQIVLK